MIRLAALIQGQLPFCSCVGDMEDKKVEPQSKFAGLR
jgi:hypothetical protein